MREIWDFVTEEVCQSGNKRGVGERLRGPKINLTGHSMIKEIMEGRKTKLEFSRFV